MCLPKISDTQHDVLVMQDKGVVGSALLSDVEYVANALSYCLISELQPLTPGIK